MATLLIKIFLCLLLPSIALAGSTVVVVGQPTSGVAPECSAVITQETQTEGMSFSEGTISQLLNIDSTITVCQVDVFLGSGSFTSHIEFWTGPDKGGSQVGGNSDSRTTGTGGLDAYTWSSNAPTLTGDVYLTVVRDAGTVVVGFTTDAVAPEGAAYENTTYSMYRGESQYANDDLTFKVYD